MTPAEALSDVCRHFCATDAHDDACIALTATVEGLGRVEALAAAWDERMRPGMVGIAKAIRVALGDA